jgi:hypothetical protein
LSLGDSGGAPSSNANNKARNKLTQGDFYVTTHSNLAQVHVVFHVVADNETILSGDAISSRHPVILGLRNVLKACSLADVTTLSIPLFLTPDMAEVSATVNTPQPTVMNLRQAHCLREHQLLTYD